MYIVGVTIGAAVTVAISRFRHRTRSDVTEALLVETIGQHCYLQATKEIVDDETDEQIKDRGSELLEEYDLDVVDPTEVDHVR
ncbi:hypothetical protein GCM10009725_30140 [Aeromicrobium tamlense]